jgi:hypothetical protein
MRPNNRQFLKLAAGAYWVAIGIWATTVSTIFYEENRLGTFFALFIVGAVMLVVQSIFSEISKNKQAKRIETLEQDVNDLKEKLGNAAPAA